MHFSYKAFLTQLRFLACFIAGTSGLTAERVIFHDTFDLASRGLRERNRVVDPVPEGMGYTTDTPYGYQLKNWLVADAEPNKQRRSFWCIPERATGEIKPYMQQSARSHNSICYARTMIPTTAHAYTIEFRQWLNDNDTIGFILGASQPHIDHDGIEFSYQRQLPGTDQTVDDIYYRGALGTGKIDGVAGMKQWRNHRIEVIGKRVRWFQEGRLLLSGFADDLTPGGYFGIRQRYERGSRYDDVRITIQDEAREQRSSRPNVLFIAIDDLRTDLGCYGNPQIQSPHLDRLARQGVRFDKAYCQYPLCNPSRASVLTGKSPDQTGANRTEINNSFHFRSKIPNVTTLPQLFQQHGYRVGRVGKLYHYGVPREIGFESALDDRESWQFALYPRGEEKNEEDQLISYTPKRSSGWALSWQESHHGDLEHTDGKVATESIRLLNELKDEPFFLAVGFYRPHVPSIAPASYFGPYPIDTITMPDEPEAHFDRIPKVAFDPGLNVEAPIENLRWFKRAYYATVSYVDSQIGRLVTALDELGLRDNTIVVVWSDHGWMLGEHRQWEKRVLFEQSLRVPLIIRAPKQPGNGMACPRVVELVDLYPTLADLAGLPVAEDLRGVSLRPLLENPLRSWQDRAFSQVGRRTLVGRSLRTPQWRYTEWNQGQEGIELYHYPDDPNEYRNLANEPSFSRIQRRLQRELEQHFR